MFREGGHTIYFGKDRNVFVYCFPFQRRRVNIYYQQFKPFIIKPRFQQRRDMVIHRHQDAKKNNAYRVCAPRMPRFQYIFYYLLFRHIYILYQCDLAIVGEIHLKCRGQLF